MVFQALAKSCAIILITLGMIVFSNNLFAQKLNIHMFDPEDITLCPADPNISAPPDFTHSNCQKLSIDKVDPQDNLIWIKAYINIAKNEYDHNRPYALIVSGKMSSKVFLNGKMVGQNGKPAKNSKLERPGKMDAQFYAPQSLFKEGQNEVIILASSYNGIVKLNQPIHAIAIGPANIGTNDLLPIISPALMTLGLFIIGFIYFALIGILGSSRTRSWTFALICFFASAQLLSETLRGLYQYDYPIHDLRIIAIAVFSAGFGLSVSFHIFKTFMKNHIIRAMIIMAILSLIALIFVPGYDYKALISMIIPLVISLFATSYWSYRRVERAFLYFIALSTFVASIIIFKSLFLDTIFFFLIAFFLLLLFMEQALTLSDEEKLRRKEQARSNQLENAIIQAKERDKSSEIIVKSAGKVEHIQTSDIIYLTSANGYTEIHLQSQRSLLHSMTLNELEETIPNIFLRIHRSHLINIMFVKSLKRDPSGTGTLTLNDGTQLPVSRRIMPKVRQALS